MITLEHVSKGFAGGSNAVSDLSLAGMQRLAVPWSRGA